MTEEKKQQKGVLDVLKVCLEVIKTNSKRAEELMHTYDALQFLKDFKTIKIGLPRQTGHTHAAKFLLSTGDVRVFVPKPKMEELYSEYKDKVTFIPFDKTLSPRLSHIEEHILIIDCASLCTQGQIDKVYDIMYKDQILIQLG